MLCFGGVMMRGCRSPFLPSILMLVYEFKPDFSFRPARFPSMYPSSILLQEHGSERRITRHHGASWRLGIALSSSFPLQMSRWSKRSRGAVWCVPNPTRWALSVLGENVLADVGFPIGPMTGPDEGPRNTHPDSQLARTGDCKEGNT